MIIDIIKALKIENIKFIKALKIEKRKFTKKQIVN